MTTPSPIHPFNSRSRLNKPPLANRAKLSNSNVFLLDHYGPLSRHNMDPLSSNASCDTTLDETASLSSREPYSMTSFNLSCYMEPVADNSESKSMTSLENHENNEDNQTILNSTLHQKKKSHVDETKYKTEMCKKWTENGQCPYGNKCRFAHGRHELNDKYLPNRSSYKSKKCNSFHFNTICPYGTRCLFAHEQRSLEELAKDTYYAKFMSCPDFLENPVMMNKRRLPVFCSETIKEQLNAIPAQGYLANSWRSLINADEYEEFKDFSSVFQNGKPGEGGEESTL